MTNAPLTAQEQTLKDFWITDGAPGFVAAGKKIGHADQAAIRALPTDTVRGYLSSYLPNKISAINASLDHHAIQANRFQAAAASLQADLTTLSALSVQPVTTSATGG
jgi:hypothetical protein